MDDLQFPISDSLQSGSTQEGVVLRKAQTYTQQNRTEGPEINPYIYDKVTKKRCQTYIYICKYHISAKRLLSRICKELLQLNNKINNSIKKWAKDLNRLFGKQTIWMAKKRMNRCLASLVITGTQSKPQ